MNNHYKWLLHAFCFEVSLRLMLLYMGLKDHTIFILGITKFDADIESTSYTTAKYLAQENDVYYVDYPYTFKDYFSDKGTEQYQKRKEGFFSAADSIIETDIKRLKILVLPPVLPINFLKENKFYRSLLAFNQNLIVNRIQTIIRKHKISNYLFINSFNFHYPNIGARLQPKLSVYHCVDPLVIEYDRRHGIVSEDMILKNSDLVICTSKKLFVEKSFKNKDTYFIPNAADLSHCSKALDESVEVYSKLKSIPRPIIGYFGNIERRIDFRMLTRVAIMNPNQSLVFAGPVNGSYVPDEFKNLENVHFIGKVAYQDMPAVLKGYDVAIIPFKKDEVSATIFPLKLFEYLGAGKPVVSTDFNEDLVEYTGEAVIYCKDTAEFNAGIQKALSLTTIVDITQRLETAAENTWEKRLLEFSQLISKYYRLKNLYEEKALHHTM